MTTFNDQLYHLGGAAVGLPFHTGNTWWVYSGATSTGLDAGGFGTKDRPFLTLDYAIGKCTADHDDLIVLLPGHAENLTTATAVNMDVAGVTVVGLGDGDAIPTFSTTAAAGSITLAAANCTLKNLRVKSNFTTGTTAGITIAATATGNTLDGVQLRETTNAKELLIGISVATGITGLTLRNLSIVGLAGGSMTNAILFAGTSVDTLIEDCYIFVDSSDSVVDHATGASVNLVMRRNAIINGDTDGALYCIEQKSDGTGICYRNFLAYNKVNAEMTVGAATWWIENYVTNTIAESGLLDPATSHAIP